MSVAWLIRILSLQSFRPYCDAPTLQNVGFAANEVSSNSFWQDNAPETDSRLPPVKALSQWCNYIFSALSKCAECQDRWGTLMLLFAAPPPAAQDNGHSHSAGGTGIGAIHFLKHNSTNILAIYTGKRNIKYHILTISRWHKLNKVIPRLNETTGD